MLKALHAQGSLIPDDVIFMALLHSDFAMYDWALANTRQLIPRHNTSASLRLLKYLDVAAHVETGSLAETLLIERLLSKLPASLTSVKHKEMYNAAMKGDLAYFKDAYRQGVLSQMGARAFRWPWEPDFDSVANIHTLTSRRLIMAFAALRGHASILKYLTNLGVPYDDPEYLMYVAWHRNRPDILPVSYFNERSAAEMRMGTWFVRPHVPVRRRHWHHYSHAHTPYSAISGHNVDVYCRVHCHFRFTLQAHHPIQIETWKGSRRLDQMQALMLSNVAATGDVHLMQVVLDAIMNPVRQNMGLGVAVSLVGCSPHSTDVPSTSRSVQCYQERMHVVQELLNDERRWPRHVNGETYAAYSASDTVLGACIKFLHVEDFMLRCLAPRATSWPQMLKNAQLWLWAFRGEDMQVSM
jgi:hypothetical protein